jgi:hypothetical protein
LPGGQVCQQSREKFEGWARDGEGLAVLVLDSQADDLVARVVS